MNVLWNGIGILFCGLAAILILRETRREFVPYVLLTLGIISFLAMLPLFRETSALLGTVTADLPYAATLLKAAGISMLTETGTEICKSAGESGVAGYVSLLGKTEILMITLPLFRQLVEMALGFLV